MRDPVIKEGRDHPGMVWKAKGKNKTKSKTEQRGKLILNHYIVNVSFWAQSKSEDAVSVMVPCEVRDMGHTTNTQDIALLTSAPH